MTEVLLTSPLRSFHYLDLPDRSYNTVMGQQTLKQYS
jgi:hypothetical protein